MKTIFKILFMMTMIAASSCGNAQSPADTPKTLVVYYSYTGNCKAIANTLLSQIEADVLEIQPAEDNLDYAANNYELGSSLIARIRENPKSANSYPAIRPTDTDLQKYSSIIIVAPLWWNNMAAPLQTYLFLNGPKMKGKHVGLVVSSYSSGISDVVGDARRLVPECQFPTGLMTSDTHRKHPQTAINQAQSTPPDKIRQTPYKFNKAHYQIPAVGFCEYERSVTSLA